MNAFGQLFRVQIFGESHGECVGVVLDGLPAGLEVPVADFLPDMERRKGGTQKGATPRKEDDIPIFKSGVFNGRTTGFPVVIYFENKNTRSGDYEKLRDFPRPGHADFVAHKKFGGYEDYRGGGHFSARLTTGLVAAGVIAKKLLNLADKTSPLPEPSGPLPGRGEESTPGYMTSTVNEWRILSDFAKQNRKNATEAEALLWEELRNRKIENCKFRRQHPVSGYIPDFVCIERKLVIEIDGGYHNNAEQQQYDNVRTEWLAEYGYGLIRFTNNEVLQEKERVVSRIAEALKKRAHLQKAESAPPP
ncbi:chorismate synthase [Niabella ginsenosidivorans]|uniref:chorismate synthase n=1 Tax=Niabella ginsenosidivorans TaxID=1176587 RepID=UPI000A067733|nr:chorismate synthase [Niabella ginsenosidivorans]